MPNARRVPLAFILLAAAACSATCIGQTTPATFHTQSYTERLSYNPYAVDVNNDGILDLVQLQAKPNAFQNATGFTSEDRKRRWFLPRTRGLSLFTFTS